MNKNLKRLFVGLTLLIAAIVVTACGNGSNNGAGDSKVKTVKVGIMDGDDRVWGPLTKRLAKEDIDIKLVKFTNYDQPNQALANGDVDLNAYQHIYFLDNWNKAHKTDLTAIGNTVIAPLAVFSNKIKKLDDLKKGDTISIPNDATNQARALQLLENAKVITLKKGVEFPTPNDVEKNPKGISIKPLDASQTARSLGDVTAAIVNNSVALDAKLDYKDAIYTEKITKQSEKWVNVIAAQKKNKDNKTFKKIVKAYQSEATRKDIKDTYEGSTIPAWDYKF